MPYPFEITIKQEISPDKIVKGEFSDDEYASLQGYLQQYEQLAESKPLRENLPSGFKMHYDREKGLQVSATLPDSDTVSILLHRLRPFILQNEPASFIRITSVIGRHIDDEYVRRLLRQERERYDIRDVQRMMRIGMSDGVKDIVLNSEKVLNNWLNSHEYHRDPDKQQAVEKLFSTLPGDLFAAILISMLVEKLQAIINIAMIVAVLLGQTQQLKFNVNMPLTSSDETSN